MSLEFGREVWTRDDSCESLVSRGNLKPSGWTRSPREGAAVRGLSSGHSVIRGQGGRRAQLVRIVHWGKKTSRKSVECTVL